MKKGMVVVLVLNLCVLVGHAQAELVGSFCGGEIGNVGMMQQVNLGELYLHTGEPYTPIKAIAYDEVHQFQYIWQTGTYNAELGALNSGSVYWSGTLDDFFNRSYIGILYVGGQEITLTGFYGENGDGHVFQGDFGFQDQVNPVSLSISEIYVVPVPGSLGLMLAAVVGLTGLARTKKDLNR